MTAAVAERIDDERFEPRDPVLHRTRAVSGDARFALLVVNLSPGGLMARCDHPLAPGDLARVELPVVGTVVVDVRWVLAGRIGCRFAAPLAAADYAQLLTLVAA